MSKRKFDTLKKLQDAVPGWTPGLLNFEDILVKKGILWNEEQFPDEGDYVAATIILVTGEQYTSQKGKVYPKGTAWIVPTK